MGLREWLRWLLGPPPRPPVPTAPKAMPRSNDPVEPGRSRVSVQQPDHARRVPTGPDPARLGLERFSPISQAELKSAAQQHNLRRDPWLGRVDTIPPADDPRTNLIDRALVAEGYFTPEQLARIHEVGDQYREFRPDFVAVAAAGQAAVVADAAELQRRKAEKQAAAQKRREEHAAAVARRRVSDIIHLGRGVSAGLADRRADPERLAQHGLPLLATPADCARFLDLPIPRLRWLAWHSDASAVSHYIFFTVPKKSGGVRRLAAPHRDLAACQRRILRELLDRIPTHSAAHGFVRGRNVRSNAEPHVGADLVVNLDLADFFPSITFPRVRGLFAGFGYSPAAATILALLCTEAPREELVWNGQRHYAASGPRALPQGACTSPALANACCRRLDARLAGLAAAWGWAYTRYADDLTFSCPDAAGADAAEPGRLLTAVRNIITDEGFQEQPDKTKVLRRNQRQEVTGLVVNQRPKLPREELRRLRAILHRARHEGLEAQNREGHPCFLAWLQGMISWVAVTDRTQAAKLQAQLQALAPPPT